MIKEFVDAFDKRKGEIRAKWRSEHPSGYADIVRAVVEILSDPDDLWLDEPDPERIHQIDDGDYQGTLVFVIADKGYQPSTYWNVMVSAEELEVRHSNVTISDVVLLRLSVESLIKSQREDSISSASEPCETQECYGYSCGIVIAQAATIAGLLDGISVALADLRAAANRMPDVDQGLVAAIYNLERAMEKHGGQS